MYAVFKITCEYLPVSWIQLTCCAGSFLHLLYPIGPLSWISSLSSVLPFSTISSSDLISMSSWKPVTLLSEPASSVFLLSTNTRIIPGKLNSFHFTYLCHGLLLYQWNLPEYFAKHDNRVVLEKVIYVTKHLLFWQ